MREVLDELLRDRGAAEIVAHAEEHVHECAGRAVPVHALMLIEALVLDRNCRVHQILGDLVIIDPYALFQTGKADELLPAAVHVLIEDRAGERHGEVLQLNVQLGGKAGLDIVCEDAHEQQRRHDEDQKDRPDGAEDRPGDAGRRAGRSVRHGADPAFLASGCHRCEDTSLA